MSDVCMRFFWIFSFCYCYKYTLECMYFVCLSKSIMCVGVILCESRRGSSLEPMRCDRTKSYLNNKININERKKQNKLIAY